MVLFLFFFNPFATSLELSTRENFLQLLVDVPYLDLAAQSTPHDNILRNKHGFAWVYLDGLCS